MRLPHWLRCRYSRWAYYDSNKDEQGFEWRANDFWYTRRWRECIVCGHRQDEHFRTGRMGGAVPLAYDPNRVKKS